LKARCINSCRSLKEVFWAEHLLQAAEVLVLQRIAKSVGFEEIRIYENCRREPFSGSLSPFLLGVRPVQESSE